jgi:hypothetical protein
MTDITFNLPMVVVREWCKDANLSGAFYDDENWAYEQHIASWASQYGADRELEACCEWLSKYRSKILAADLRYVRRPKPPSLKEQALELARPAGTEGAHVTFGPEELALIRRALEQLPDHK